MSYLRMNRAFSLVLAITAVAVALASPVMAQFTPTFSVDFQGPTAGFIPGPGTGVPDTFFGAPIDEGQILTPFFPGPPGPNPPSFGPLPSPGMMVDSIASPLGTAPGGLGILPSAFGGIELDALSYGRDQGDQLFFSVDEFASGDLLLGPAFPNVVTEGALGASEASADVFRYLGPAVVTPALGAGIGPGNVDVIDGDGLLPFGGAGLGLIEPNFPTPGGGTDIGDNLDAVDVDTSPGDVFGPIYFSLDSFFPDPLDGPPANTGTALGNGFVGGDVLMSFAGGAPAMYAPAPMLGLDILAGPDSDDLDALALFDDGDGVFSPGIDMLLFSVRRGSAVIGSPDSAFGIPIEEGDVLTLPVLAGISPFPSIFITAESLGLGTLRSGTAGQFPFGDELDALDLSQIPEPGSMVLALLGLSSMGLVRRRQRG